jgi:hypothetical protein
MKYVFTRDKCQNKQKGTEWVLGFGHSIHKLLEYIDNGGNPRYCTTAKFSVT